MITEIKTSRDILKFITKETDSGLYIECYKNLDISHRFSSDISEEEFHKELREKYRDNLVE